MKKSLIQIYQDIGGKVLFAQVMKADALEMRRKESDEMDFNFDAILEGTEKIYESNFDHIKLNKSFITKIVREHRDWRKDESIPMMGENDRFYGVSYPFFPEHYNELNQEIISKLGLKAR